MVILSLGFILIAGLFSAKIIRRLKLPMVTAYLLLGILVGPAFLNMISDGIIIHSGLISNIVLGFIAFNLGQNFSADSMRKMGRSLLWISILAAVGAWFLVTAAFLFFKQPFYVALLFGAIASATAPAATVMVAREYKAKGSFTDTLLAVVAIDDAWCLVIFAVSLAIAKAVAVAGTAANGVVTEAVMRAFLEIGGAFLLGGAVAWIAGYFSRYARTSTDLLIYTLGFIFLTTGLAVYLGLSVLLANMFLGAVLVNIHRLSFKFFDTLRTVDTPLYLIFFVLAGANLEIGLLAKLGLLGLVYVLFRSIGKIAGGFIGGLIARSPERIRNNIGLALLPQAGVALGVALIAKDTFPQYGGIIFSTTVATTVVFEIFGPLATRFALRNAGEA